MTDQARETFKKWFTKKYGFLPSITDETLWEAFVAAYDLGLSSGREQAAHPGSQLTTALKYFPEQYLRERLSFEYNDRSSMFEITGGGFVVAQAEDSEVANAICFILNILRESQSRAVGATQPEVK